MSTSILDRSLVSPPSSPLTSSSSTVAQSVATVSSSLQYFYHCLTPDTLILPQLHPIAAAAHCHRLHQSHHHHHHHHHHYHRHQLQVQMMIGNQQQKHLDLSKSLHGSLVENQLEEIIHLCRAMSIQNQHRPPPPPPNVNYPSKCDNCRLARRYSADCVRYLYGTSEMRDNGTNETSFDASIPRNGVCGGDGQPPINHSSENSHHYHNPGGGGGGGNIVTELVAKFEQRLMPKSSEEESAVGGKQEQCDVRMQHLLPVDLVLSAPATATPMNRQSPGNNADKRRLPVPPPKPDYLKRGTKLVHRPSPPPPASSSPPAMNSDPKQPHHNCCCCCCYCSNNLLGIDLSNAHHKCDQHGNHNLPGNESTRQCNKKDDDHQDLTSEKKKCPKLRKLTSAKTAINCESGNLLTSPPPPPPSPPTNNNSSASDNSSSDEGIENPPILEDDDELEELITKELLNEDDSVNSSRAASSHHSHHQHHFNHHNLNYSHFNQQPQQHSRNLSSALSFATTGTEFETVERFLNGTDLKHFTTLKEEESLLLREILELEREQSSGAKKNNDGEEEDEIDEELLEFQRIEREIKLSELRKCLQLIQKQIENYRQKMEIEHFEEERKQLNELDSNQSRNSQLGQFVNMTDSMIEECRLDAAQQVNLSPTKPSELDDLPKKFAPLAEPEQDSESQVVNFELAEADSRLQTAKLNVCLQENSANRSARLVLSDTESEDESVRNRFSKDSTKNGYLENLDDLLHDSIEESLEMINKVTEQEQETFLVCAKPQTASSIIRRESQYENERTHQCDMEHFGYRNMDMHMLKNVYNKINSNNDENGNNQPTIDVDEMLESTTTNTEDTDDNSFVLRRCSGRFPTDEDVTKQSTDNLDSIKPMLRTKRPSNTGSQSLAPSQRPLTLYMPSPNEELNLITHLHALGHDLTSAIVTNHLLITPFTCSGYLYKQCAGSTSKWRKRYFHFNRVRKVFVYFHDRVSFEKRHHPKRGVFFDEIQDVYVDHTRINMKKFLPQSSSKSSSSHHQSPNVSNSTLAIPAKADGTRCVFVVSTTTINRKFILSTYVPELMRIWMDVIFTGANAYLQDLVDD